MFYLFLITLLVSANPLCHVIANPSVRGEAISATLCVSKGWSTEPGGIQPHIERCLLN